MRNDCNIDTVNYETFYYAIIKSHRRTCIVKRSIPLGSLATGDADRLNGDADLTKAVAAGKHEAGDAPTTIGD